MLRTFFIAISLLLSGLASADTITKSVQSSGKHGGNATIISKTIIVSGNDSQIQIIDNKIFVDGKDVTPEGKQLLNVTIQGNFNSLECSSCSTVTVNGDTKDIDTASGNVDITGNVDGRVTTMSGDVHVKGNVAGGVKTMSGDIRR